MNEQSQRAMIERQADQIAFNSADLDRLVTGTTGNDVIAVGDGTRNTLVRARAGDDQIVTGIGNDLIRCGDGDDTVEAGGGDDIVVGEDGNDVMWGETGNDFLLGYTGDDRIYGGEGNDILEGGAGNDLLKGGEGNDVLSGGVGDDGFVFSIGDGADSIIGTESLRVSELSGHDKVVFTDIEADGLASVNLDRGPGRRDLIVRYGDGDVLTIVAQDGGREGLIDSFRFADGQELDTAALLQKYAGPGGTLAGSRTSGAQQDLQSAPQPSASGVAPLQQILLAPCTVHGVGTLFPTSCLMEHPAQAIPGM